jgi:hypothetical protein
MRSAESIAFEEAWEAARGDARVPERNAIDLKRFAKFARWFAIIEPDLAQMSLPFRLVGSGFFDFFKADLTGSDYLGLADPSIRDEAYASVIACLKQPCGLWQSTPVQLADGLVIPYEYTILPISKTGAGVDHIVIYVHYVPKPADDVPSVSRVEHSTVWHWLDIGFGVPDIAF